MGFGEAQTGAGTPVRRHWAPRPTLHSSPGLPTQWRHWGPQPGVSATSQHLAAGALDSWSRSSPQPMTKEVENDMHQLPPLQVEQSQTCPRALPQVPGRTEPHLLNDVPLESSFPSSPLLSEITS